MGINYGNDKTNIDPKTGIRYGVISQNSVLQAWCDSSEPYYPCDECEFQEDAEDKDFSDEVDNPENEEEIEEARQSYYEEKESACGFCEPTSFYYEDEGYSLESAFDNTEIFVLKSPYFTLDGTFCSPCAPGAINLDSLVEGEGDAIAYCLGHDWFDDDKAPYRVFRVSDGKEVFAYRILLWDKSLSEPAYSAQNPQENISIYGIDNYDALQEALKHYPPSNSFYDVTVEKY